MAFHSPVFNKVFLRPDWKIKNDLDIALCKHTTKRRLKHCYEGLLIKLFLKIMFHKKNVGERLVSKKLATFCKIMLLSGPFVATFSPLLQRVYDVFLYYALLCIAVVYNWGY